MTKAKTIYMTNKARKSHYENIEEIQSRLRTNADVVKALGLKDVQDIIHYLDALKVAISNEYTGK